MSNVPRSFSTPASRPLMPDHGGAIAQAAPTPQRPTPEQTEVHRIATLRQWLAVAPKSTELAARVERAILMGESLESATPDLRAIAQGEAKKEAATDEDKFVADAIAIARTAPKVYRDTDRNGEFASAVSVNTPGRA